MENLQALKEMIGKRVEYDGFGQMIFGKYQNGHSELICDIRGWGKIQNMFPNERLAAEFQNFMGKFIQDAINEKLAKEDTNAK